MEHISLKTLWELSEAGLIKYSMWHIQDCRAYLIGEHSKDGTLSSVTSIETLINKLNQTKEKS